LGNPFNEELQRQILIEGLKDLEEIDEPGTIVDLAKTYGGDERKCLACRAA
jgi:hypothetical protein